MQGWEVKFNASQLEIYNETIRDLLAEDGGVVLKSQPKHCERTGATTVAGLSEHAVETTEQVADLLKVAQSNRSVAATKMNATSSRSHSVFLLRVSAARTAPSRNGAPGKVETRNSTLVMVDLAGE